SLRPLPDTMSRLSALLPVAQGVAAFAALSRQADTARAAGDPRSRGQVMADTLVERITGQATAAGVPVEVQVVLSDAALFGSGPGADDPAQVPGYGTVPAGWVRDLLAGSDADTGDAGRAATAEARVWLRRLYATPDRSRLVAMESRRRAFGRGLRRFLVTRDGGRCRAPWCDAPIRHLDHVADHGGGGATAARNGQGLCERCNQTKTLPGWRVEVADDGSRGSPHRTRWRTPAGTVYDATAPPLLPGAVPIGAEPAVPTQSRIELALAAALAA
ncbi:MAG TPA: HNH endonuclease, partial [Candidatus Nanopelagicales bacterium]|nr:HNH endonuclease [Candidatus Nanopelagicales bacterium]